MPAAEVSGGSWGMVQASSAAEPAQSCGTASSTSSPQRTKPLPPPPTTPLPALTAAPSPQVKVGVEAALTSVLHDKIGAISSTVLPRAEGHTHTAQPPRRDARA
eukprot:239805-Rhodomonas_salina.2